MWTQLLLSALIGSAAASNNGWKSNTEYEYEVYGRTLTALHDLADQYSGIVLKAKLFIHSESDGSLMAKIVNAQYSQVHSNLPEGWKSEIGEQHLQYKQLELTEKPFQIILRNGIIHEVIVDRRTANWEANIIKAIVSQVQLDIEGENVVKAHVNQLPEEDSNSAVFKTMEDTITGTYETLYDISTLPEYVWRSQPELVPIPELQNDGEIIEIVKTKNYSRSEERLGYYYGFGAAGRFEPITNHMGDFFLRSGFSRIVVSGNLHRYTIQSASSTNKIILSPTLNSEQKGMVVSHLNLTLAGLRPVQEQYQHPEDGQKLGSLTYTFNTPFSVAENDTKLDQPPQSPLLPLYVGYKGKSIKYSDKINVVEVTAKLAQQIGNEIQHGQEIPKEQTLTKFVALSSVVRILNEEEMKQVTHKLYTEQVYGPQAGAWKTYRDAIAEAGTGPALLTIKAWIKNKEIQHEEAADVIANFANSVRQPTEEFMRVFYELCNKDEDVRRQAILNDTAILNYATLARRVYVNKRASHNQYPVHSFGSFRTQYGKKFVAEELIPHLKKQLNHAISNADNHSILVYIRALGNVAHPNILEAFEPYLEGQKQCTQFQRLQIVIAFDKLVKVHPKIARSVLYKIYQNAGEAQELRVAAVYQLMRTSPPASMLQRMAQYTNVDTSQQVNAAVKSSIESASRLQGAEFEELRVNARSAEGLLTKEKYGVQYSNNFLQSYIAHELNLYYKQTYQTYGSSDSFFSKGFKYALRAAFGGTRRQLIIAQVMVSSVEELTNVFQRQTAKYEKQQEQQEQANQQAKQETWSSEYIAGLLNIHQEERDQLEGSLLYQLSGDSTHFFTFNNHTIGLLPEFLHGVEDVLRAGKEFHYTKFTNRHDVCLAFPTEMALPFVYSLDSPTLQQVDGKISATADPPISNGHVIRFPQTITADNEMHVVASTKVQAKIGFITPFDHQHYIAGYDKNLHVELPVKSCYEIDLREKKIRAEFQALEPGQDQMVFHYSSWPYTAQRDILQFANGQHNKIIYAAKEPQTQWNTMIGKDTGMVFRVSYTSEQKFADMWRTVYEQYQRNDAVSALLAARYDKTLQHVKLDVEYAAQETSAQKVQLTFGYTMYEEQEEGHGNAEISQFKDLPQESTARQNKFAKMVSAGITSSYAHIMDFAIEFLGQRKNEYIATIAIAKSPVDPKSRVLFYYKQQGAKSYEVAFSGKANVPNTNSLDFNYALDFDPTTTAEAVLSFGTDLQSANQMHLQVKYDQSEEHKQYLKNSYRTLECYKEMKYGNKQLPACANMTIEANRLDHINVHLQIDELTPMIRNVTYGWYNYLRYLSYYYMDENLIDPQTTESENQMSVEARFEPDFGAVNVTIKTHDMKSHIKEIRVNEWAQQFFVVHPSVRKTDRIMGHAYAFDTFRPFCIVDQSAANTFDNKTYEVKLGNEWSVMMYYSPQYGQQQEYQLEQYAIFVRKDQSGQYQELKMTLRTPDTQGQTIEFDFMPEGQCGDSQPCAKITHNGKAVQYNKHETFEAHQGLVQIYALPNGEVKCEVQNAFYIIYDGHRAKIVATHDKLRGSLRGLCGTYDGEVTTDFLAPENCIYQQPQDFIASYQITEGHQQKMSNGQKECVKQEIEYVNIISNHDAGRQQQ